MESEKILTKKYFYDFLCQKSAEWNLELDISINQGINKIEEHGDLIITFHPASHSEREKKELKDCTFAKYIEGCLQCHRFIAKAELFRESSCRIFLNRKIFFAVALCNNVAPEVWLKSHRPHKNLNINVTLHINSVSSSVSGARCLMVGKHIANLFAIAGMKIYVSPSCLETEKLGCKHDLDQLSSFPRLDQKTDLEKVSTYVEETKDEVKLDKLELDYFVVSNSHIECKGSVLLCSFVTSQKESTKLGMTTDLYISHLEKEIHDASKHKYRDLSSSSWKEFILAEATNCQILQFMMVSHLSPVKVDLSDASSNSRAGAFILYNYARICVLLKNLNTLIEKNQLPSMPAPCAVDFTLLKHQEEWELSWVYVNRFPDLLYETLDELIMLGVNVTEQSNQLKAKRSLLKSDIDKKEENTCKKKTKQLHFPTHKIAKFLHSLSHCLSVYYNRVHILPATTKKQNETVCEVAPHLIPVLWARIYLLKAVQTVMSTCFRTLDIIPHTVM